MMTVSVFGGTGFLGQRLVRRLATEGMAVRVVTRDAERARVALHAAGLERMTVFCADVRNQAAVVGALAGADAVVNAVSAYVDRGGAFEAVHEQGAKTLAREALAAGVARFVLVSGIGADPESNSPYIRSRGRGERLVQEAFPGASIVRPSVMFGGPGDALFGTVAQLSRVLPVLPLIGDGRTRLQPVYVEDVAEAIARMLVDPAAAGKTYELAGPRVYTLRNLFTIALRILRQRRLLVSIPFAVAEALARLFEHLSNPPLTTGQVDLLRADNVTTGNAPGLRELGIEPKAIEDIVPTYLLRSRAGA
jgi:NADH dehydrogenase